MRQFEHSTIVTRILTKHSHYISFTHDVATQTRHERSSRHKYNFEILKLRGDTQFALIEFNTRGECNPVPFNTWFRGADRQSTSFPANAATRICTTSEVSPRRCRPIGRERAAEAPGGPATDEPTEARTCSANTRSSLRRTPRTAPPSDAPADRAGPVTCCAPRGHHMPATPGRSSYATGRESRAVAQCRPVRVATRRATSARCVPDAE